MLTTYKRIDIVNTSLLVLPLQLFANFDNETVAENTPYDTFIADQIQKYFFVYAIKQLIYLFNLTLLFLKYACMLGKL